MGALAAIGSGIARAFGWLIEKPSRAVCAVLIAALAFHLLIVDPGLRSQRDSARAERDKAEALVAALRNDLAAERTAHQQTKHNYRAAQEQAAALEAARLAAVQAEQKEITDAVTQDYRQRLADARAHAERLRDQLARAGAGAAGAPRSEPVPGAGGAAGRAAPPATGDRLPPAPALSEDEIAWRLIATEQAIQLDALIDWVERQAQVEVNR